MLYALSTYLRMSIANSKITNQIVWLQGYWYFCYAWGLIFTITGVLIFLQLHICSNVWWVRCVHMMRGPDLIILSSCLRRLVLHKVTSSLWWHHDLLVNPKMNIWMNIMEVTFSDPLFIKWQRQTINKRKKQNIWVKISIIWLGEDSH